MKRNLFILLMLIGCMSANAQMGYYNNSGFVELTPDKSFIYKFVMAWDEVSENTLSDLYASMQKVQDQSILKRTAGGWYVKNDYPLPEGNYYESTFYNNNSIAHYNELYVILPEFDLYLNNSGKIDGLMEYLGDKVTIKSQNGPDLVGGTRYRFTCNVKTSEEVLEIGMLVNDLSYVGLAYFVPYKFEIDRDMYNGLINMLTENSENDIIAEIDWTTWDHYYGWDWDYVSTIKGVGLIIDCTPCDGANYWEPQVAMIANIPELKKGGHYLMKFTIETPVAGEIRLDLCSWDGSGASMAQIINVEAGEKEYQVDFFDYPTTCTDGMVFYQCGHLPGQHIIKKVQVFKMGEESARGHETTIHVVKAEKADENVYNLSGQKVDASYKGVVIQNGKKTLQN